MTDKQPNITDLSERDRRALLRADKHDEDMVGIKINIGVLLNSQNDLIKKVESLEQKYDSHERKIDTKFVEVNKKLENIKSFVDTQNGEMKALKKWGPRLILVSFIVGGILFDAITGKISGLGNITFKSSQQSSRHDNT